MHSDVSASVPDFFFESPVRIIIWTTEEITFRTERPKSCEQPGCDIAPLAIDIGAFADHIAEIDADPQYDLTGAWNVDIRLCHLPLKLDRRLDGVNRAGEFDQNTIAHQFDDAPAMRAYHWVEHMPSVLLQSVE